MNKYFLRNKHTHTLKCCCGHRGYIGADIVGVIVCNYVGTRFTACSCTIHNYPVRKQSIRLRSLSLSKTMFIVNIFVSIHL